MKASLNTRVVTKQVVKEICIPDNITICMSLKEARILATVIGQIPPPQAREWIQKAGVNQTMAEKRYDFFSTNPMMLTVTDVSKSFSALYNSLSEQLRDAARLVEKQS